MAKDKVKRTTTGQSKEDAIVISSDSEEDKETSRSNKATRMLTSSDSGNGRSASPSEMHRRRAGSEAEVETTVGLSPQTTHATNTSVVLSLPKKAHEDGKNSSNKRVKTGAGSSGSRA